MYMRAVLLLFSGFILTVTYIALQAISCVSFPKLNCAAYIGPYLQTEWHAPGVLTVLLLHALGVLT